MVTTSISLSDENFKAWKDSKLSLNDLVGYGLQYQEEKLKFDTAQLKLSLIAEENQKIIDKLQLKLTEVNSLLFDEQEKTRKMTLELIELKK